MAHTVLVTGATGYIGGRLIPRLLQRGFSVRAFVRDPGRLDGTPWLGDIEIAQGDMQDAASVRQALDGVDTAYYLVHSMDGRGAFEQREARAAHMFAEAAGGRPHVVYLGGLVPRSGTASRHLRSREHVGAILREHCRTTEFRAGPVIGSGSASFEMVRYLAERLPVMIAPQWIDNEVQPVCIRDVLSYLAAAVDAGPSGIVDIGADRLTFRDMLHRYARDRRLKRRIYAAPVLTPRLAALWVGLVTPIPNSLAVPLVEGIQQPVTADTTQAGKIFPHIRPMPYEQAVHLALNKLRTGGAETHWSGALGTADAVEFTDREGMMREVRTLHVEAPPGLVFRSVSAIGGEHGWPAWRWAWELRGLLDRLLGGPGLKRGRRHPTELRQGEALDFWRVEVYRAPHMLRLRAEMRAPGRAWLQWELLPEGYGTRLVQTASLAPKGLSGALYWYALFPVHRYLFSDMVHAIAEKAEKHAADSATGDNSRSPFEDRSAAPVR